MVLKLLQRSKPFKDLRSKNARTFPRRKRQANIFQRHFIKIQSIYDKRHLSTVLVHWSGLLFHCFF